MFEERYRKANDELHAPAELLDRIKAQADAEDELTAFRKARGASSKAKINGGLLRYAAAAAVFVAVAGLSAFALNHNILTKNRAALYSDMASLSAAAPEEQPAEGLAAMPAMKSLAPAEDALPTANEEDAPAAPGAEEVDGAGLSAFAAAPALAPEDNAGGAPDGAILRSMAIPEENAETEQGLMAMSAEIPENDAAAPALIPEDNAGGAPEDSVLPSAEPKDSLNDSGTDAVSSAPADYDDLFDRITALYPSLTGTDVLTGSSITPVNETPLAASEADAEGTGLEPAYDYTAPAAGGNGGEETAVIDHSDTNAQVQGIDEAEILKTDGRIICYLTGKTNELIITDAKGKDTALLSRTALPAEDQRHVLWGDSAEMYLRGDRLAVIMNGSAVSELPYGDVLRSAELEEDVKARSAFTSSELPYGDVLRSAELEEDVKARSAFTSSELPYGDVLRSAELEEDVKARSAFTSSAAGYESHTRILIYDISDPAAPVLLKTLGQSGSYQTSRMVGDTLYVISEQNLFGAVDRAVPASYCPALYDHDEAALLEPGDLCIPENAAAPAYTVIGAADLSSEDLRLSGKAVFGAAGTVYMDETALVLCSTRHETVTGEEQKDEEGRNVVINEHSASTDLLLFTIGSEGLTPAAEATIPGELLSSFSLDRKDGILRLVTMESVWQEIIRTDGLGSSEWDEYTSTALYTLNEQLQVVGTLKGLGEEEFVESVRFDGNIAYVVTFRQTDPLFTIDLTDPADPKLCSALKIPGFSEYLHPFGDGLLLGVGYNADETSGGTDGVKLSMFDVSDPTDVTEAFTLAVSADWSEVGSNHRAILVSVDRGLMAFPTEGSYRLFTFDRAEGFKERAAVPVQSMISDGRTRGAYVENALYVLTPAGLTVIDLQSFTAVGALSFNTETEEARS